MATIAHGYQFSNAVCKTIRTIKNNDGDFINDPTGFINDL